MSEKARPRWGDKYGGVAGVHHFPSEKAAELARLIGVDDPKGAETLRAALDEIAGGYWAYRALAKGPSPAEMHAALSEITSLARDLDKRLHQLDQASRGQVFKAYRLMKNHLPGDEADEVPMHPFDRDRKHVHRLWFNIVAAKKGIKVRRGAKGIPTERWLAMRLARLYQDATGERFVVSSKRGRDSAAQFVEVALKELGPGLTPAQVGTALRYAVRILKDSTIVPVGPVVRPRVPTLTAPPKQK